MDPAAAKQQIVERVKQANKFLVTVNANPSIDQLAACIGLTLMINKMGKHATAVFSGKVPNIIEFLHPEKTLQTTTDALQDFIISLDKNKADKLRYKVENDVVRIFITPYRSSISEKDLVFSEGDFNVEVVIALGVSLRTQLDAAITAHGRILHDATVISVNNGVAKAPDLGQINWFDQGASSLSEMLVSISEALGTGLIDSQIATAYLTGIVAETQRFSNNKTSPKVMTMSAQLMAAGANQQLIAEKLAPKPPPPQPPPPPKQPPPPPPNKPAPPPKPKQPPLKPEGVIDVPHDGEKPPVAQSQDDTTEIHIDEQGNLVTEQLLSAAGPSAAEPADIPPVAPPPPPPPPPPAAMPAPASPVAPPSTTPWFEPSSQATNSLPQITGVRGTNDTAAPQPAPDTPPLPPVGAVPSVGPTSHHAFLGNTGQPGATPAPATGQPDWAAPYDLVPMTPTPALGDAGSTTSEFGSPPASTDPAVDQSNFSQGRQMSPPPVPGVNNARSAVDQAIAAAPYDPAFSAPVQALNAQPLSAQAANHEAPDMLVDVPPMQNSDTPMLVLPNSVDYATGAPPAAGAVNPSVSGVAPAAPPPVPPPLMPMPGQTA